MEQEGLPNAGYVEVFLDFSKSVTTLMWNADFMTREPPSNG